MMSTDDDGRAATGVTVAQLAAEELFRDSMVGGSGGAHRIVTWCLPGGSHARCGSSDMRGAAVFVETAELAAHAAELIPSLAERQAAAVLAWPAEPDRQHDLDAAIRAADTAELPLLRLSTRATFRETSQLIATKVLAHSTHVLEYGARVHRTLGDVFARGAGLGALARTMAQMSGTEVLVLNHGGELLEQGCERRTTPSEASVVTRIVDALTDDGFFCDRIVDDDTAHVRTVELGDRPRHVVVTRIVVAGQPYGVLVLIEPEFPAAEHDLAQHVVMAEQGVSLTGSELLRQQSIREAEERARNDFVHALLHGRFTDQFELSARAEHYDFPADGRFAVLIISSPDIRPDDTSRRLRAVDVARAARKVAVDDDAASLSALVGSMIVVIRQVPGGSADSPEEAKHLQHLGEELHRTATRRLGDRVTVSIGRPGAGASGIAQSYREGRTAVALGKQVDAGPVRAYQDLQVYAALQESARSAAGQAFAAEMLAPLQQSDGQTGNLESVVLAYIAEAGNLNATARRLHLHRNTMLYKLERASRALQMDVRTTDAQFKIWLAQHISALSEVADQLDAELAPPS
jgi:sugar diacid utilization regulator